MEALTKALIQKFSEKLGVSMRHANHLNPCHEALLARLHAAKLAPACLKKHIARAHVPGADA